MKLFGLASQPCTLAAADRRHMTAFAMLSSTIARRRSVVDNEHGFAMVAGLMLLLLTLTLGSATLLYTLLDLKSTQHYKTGNQAFAAAEAGVLDAVNTVETRGVVNFQNDVVNSGIISTALTALVGFPTYTYQVTSLVSGANPATDGILTVTGNAPLSAQRAITVGLKRGGLVGGAGALHLSNDSALGSFAGNSMVIDGDNWQVTGEFSSGIAVAQDNSVCPNGSCPRPAISTRNDTVTTEVVTALAGQGTIIGLGPAPSVFTTSAASTADLLRFVNDVIAANGATNGCDGNGANDYWRPNGNGPTGVHCVPQTKGNQGNHNTPDFWGTMAVPNVTYVTDPTARIAGGSSGAGVLIFAGDVDFHGSFTFCGWVLFKNPSANGITIGGNPVIYGMVWSPLPAFTGGGSITVKYSQNCLVEADLAGGNLNGGNVPHPLKITSWAD